MTATNTEHKKMSRPVAIFSGIVGLVVMVGGIAKFSKGVSEMRGAKGNPELQTLLQEIDAAVAEANKFGVEAMPKFQQLLNDVDSLGLNEVRAQQQEVATNVADLFGKSAEQFRLAASKSQQAADLETRENYQQFLKGKAQAYESFAQARTLNQEIARLVLDESVVDVNELVSKATELGKQRDEWETSGAESDAKAEALVGTAKANNS